jgi:glycosyltransferase involved in cell wall biosynthesis
MKRSVTPIIAHFTFAIDSHLAGVSEAVCLLSETLKQVGVESQIFSFGNSRTAQSRSLGLYNRYAQTGTKVCVDWSPISNQYGIGNPFTALNFLSKPSFDLVIIHQIFTLSTLYGYIYCRLHKLQFLIMPHGVFSAHIRDKNRLIKFIAMKFVLTKIFKHVTCFVATSESEARDIKKITNQESVVLTLGSTLPSKVPELIQEKNRWIILYAGRFGVEKNLDALIEAWADLSNDNPELTLKLVGYRSLKELELIKNSIHKNNLDDRVLVAPWQTTAELSNEFLASRLFVLPSFTENFGIVAAQALAHGVPCMVSPAVPLAKLIIEHRAGSVSSGFSANEIRSAISQILKVDFQSLSKNALALTSKEFNSQRIGENWLSFFQSMQITKRR